MNTTRPEKASDPTRELEELARSCRPEWLAFCRRLIQTPSLPGQEGDVARLIREEMEKLGYDRVWVDRVGNVIGHMRGEAGRSLIFNGHMDHVDPGPEDRWSHPPYAAHVDGSWLWGRGASDMKAALALQVYSLGLLRRMGYTLPGDCYVTAVVLEEKGGLGTRNLVRELKADMAVVGEATSNQIARGHRGRFEIIVRVTGRSVHASVPDRGANPHYSIARFLTELQQLPMAMDDDFGPSTVVPTLYHTDQTSGNVTPGEVELYLDWRNIPGETVEDALTKLRSILATSLQDGCRGEVELNVTRLATYTGHEQDLPREFPSFVLPLDHALVVNARRVLQSALGHEVPVGTWKFATDGAHLVNAGIPTIGFSPASEQYPHTTEDRIEIEAMVEGLAGYMALALELGRM